MREGDACLMNLTGGHVCDERRGHSNGTVNNVYKCGRTIGLRRAFDTVSCQSAVWTICRLPKLFHKINSTVRFGRNLKRGTWGPRRFLASVRVSCSGLGHVCNLGNCGETPYVAENVPKTA